MVLFLGRFFLGFNLPLRVKLCAFFGEFGPLFGCRTVVDRWQFDSSFCRLICRGNFLVVLRGDRAAVRGVDCVSHQYTGAAW